MKRHLPSILLGMAAGAVYYLTSAPGISWIHDSRDSGELAACAAIAGIAHPTGYPLYTMLGWILIRIFTIPEPARVMVLLSVISGSISVGVITYASSRIIPLVSPKFNHPAVVWSGVIPGIFALAFPLLWSQSVVCEVYSLAVLLQSLMWLVIVNFLNDLQKDASTAFRTFSLSAGILSGLIWAHHIGGLVILTALAITSIYGWTKLRSDTKASAINAWNYFTRFIVSVIPGLLLYLYLPIRSAMNPLLDWGNPETPLNFYRHVTAGQYQGAVFRTQLHEFIKRIADFPLMQTEWAVFYFIGLAGLICLLALKNWGSKSLSLSILAVVLISIIASIGYDVSDYDQFMYPAAVALSMLIGIPFFFLFFYKKSKWFFYAYLILCVLLLSFEVLNNQPDMDASGFRANEVSIYVYRAYSAIPENAIVIVGTDGSSSALNYAVNCGIPPWDTGDFLPPRDDVDIVTASFIEFEWYRQNIRIWNRNRNEIIIPDTDQTDLELISSFIEANMPYRPVLVGLYTRSRLQSNFYEFDYTRAGSLFLVSHRELPIE